jgi:hypothetical protein
MYVIGFIPKSASILISLVQMLGWACCAHTTHAYRY